MHSPRSDHKQRKIFESEHICFHCIFFNHLYVLLQSMGLSGGNQTNISDKTGQIIVKLCQICVTIST